VIEAFKLEYNYQGISDIAPYCCLLFFSQSYDMQVYRQAEEQILHYQRLILETRD
jgi:hypothetical protein